VEWSMAWACRRESQDSWGARFPSATLCAASLWDRTCFTALRMTGGG